jgi:hypothetical protein
MDNIIFSTLKSNYIIGGGESNDDVKKCIIILIIASIIILIIYNLQNINITQLKCNQRKEIGPHIIDNETSQHKKIGQRATNNETHQHQEIRTYAINNGSQQRHNTYSATFKSAGLTITGGYRTFDGADQSTKNSNFRHRAAASYDMGVAKIGAGYETTQATYGDTTTDTVIGLSAPLGALTISAQFGQRTKAGGTADSTYAGTIEDLHQQKVAGAIETVYVDSPAAGSP